MNGFYMSLNIIESLMVIAASIAAIIGVLNWRIVAVNQRKMDFALDVLSDFHLMRQYAESVRNPFVTLKEKDGVGLANVGFKVNQLLYVTTIHNRFKAVNGDVMRLKSKRGMFISWFGQSEPIDEVIDCMRQIYVSSAVLMKYFEDGIESDDIKEKYEILCVQENGDKIYSRIDAAIEVLEKKVIRASGRKMRNLKIKKAGRK